MTIPNRALSITLLIFASNLAAQAHFAPGRSYQVPTLQTVYYVTAGDVDGDGFPDLVTGNDHNANVLLLNDRKGSFIDATAGRLLTPMPNATYQVDLGDLDGDGDLDLVTCNDHNLQNRVYLNNGVGSFTDVTASNLPADSDWTESQALVDVDLDGDLDIVFGNMSTPDRLYLNNGAGVFVDASTRMPAGVTRSSWIAAGDLNGDGLPDLLIFGTTLCRALLNSAAGTFTPAPSGFLPRTYGNTPEIADVNGDGRNDVLYNGGTVLLLAQAGGGFVDVTATNLPPQTSFVGYMVTADVDLDGDLDLLGGRALHLNDGTGVFTDVTASRMPVVSSPSGYRKAVADFDGDGDLDLCASNYSGGVMMMNFDRGVNAPTAPVLGGEYTLNLNARPGYATASHLALPAWSFSESSSWIPGIGHLGLDPRAIFVSSLVTIPRTTGFVSLRIGVPVDPRLRGQSFSFQALIFDPAAPRQLSNTITDSVQ